MVTSKAIHVEVKSDRDAMAAIEAVRDDGVPREIERNGEIKHPAGQFHRRFLVVDCDRSMRALSDPEGVLGAFQNERNDQVLFVAKMLDQPPQ